MSIVGMDGKPKGQAMDPSTIAEVIILGKYMHLKLYQL